jgi:hypothetical protein
MSAPCPFRDVTCHLFQEWSPHLGQQLWKGFPDPSIWSSCTQEPRRFYGG